MESIFESKPCSRCGGCGRFSWCEMYGDTCFKCQGRGYTLTARGDAARKFYEASLTVSLSELQIGMKVYDTFYGKFFTVTEIGSDRVVTERIAYAGLKDSSTFRIKPRTQEELAEKRASALAHQATLTKKGTPRVR
jgi:hypothetical protein